MKTTIIIEFNVDVNIINNTYEPKIIKNITHKHINAIYSSIKSNARLNSSGEIISDKFGIIILDNCAVNFSSNIMHVKFTIQISNTENFLSLCTNLNQNENLTNIIDAEEIIWSVFPASYSNDFTYIFEFKIDGQFRSFNYLLRFNDVPTNIKIYS